MHAESSFEMTCLSNFLCYYGSYIKAYNGILVTVLLTLCLLMPLNFLKLSFKSPGPTVNVVV